MKSPLFKSKKAGHANKADTGLKAVLESGSTLKLVKWIDTAQKNSGGGMYAIVDNEYGQDIAANRDTYQAAIKQHAAELGEHYSTPVPLPLCGSILEKLHVKVPTDLILHLDITECVDEFFGLSYQPRRAESRYEPDFKQRVVERIKSKYNEFSDMIDEIESDGKIDACASSSNIEDMIEMYGRSAVKLWWRSLSGNEASEFSHTMCADTWIYQLREMFGTNPEVRFHSDAI